MRGGDSRHGRRSDQEYRRHVSRAMQSRCSHVRMEAKRRALDEIGARQGAADEKRKAEAEQPEPSTSASESAVLQ
jgi:hypothetical protein